MADTGDDIFNNLPRRRKRAVEDDDARSFFRERRGVYVPEGPLPPRPHASGKGGPSLTASNAPPVLSASPVVTGTPAVGQTLSCSQGVWFNSPTSYTYQWLRDGTVISGATASTYVVVSGDLGHSISCTVTATNAFGSTPATSNAVVIVALPVNTAAPVISGSLTVGSTLSCTQGTWSNSPTSYAYQWQRGGTNISGATSSTYVTVSADGGTSVGCLVTATNASGSASQASNTLAISAGGATSVWSASDAAAGGMTLSNGGLTVTPGTIASANAIRSTTSKTSGKVYVEFSNSVAAANWQFAIGLGSAGMVITGGSGALGFSNYSFGIETLTTVTVSAGFTANYTPNGPDWQPPAGTVFALAIDFTAGTVWFADNNVWTNSSNPATGSLPAVSFVPATVGALFAAMDFNAQSGGVGVWTLQATAASQTYAPPAGFTPWG